MTKMTKMDMMMKDNELDTVVGGGTCVVYKDPETNKYCAYMSDHKIDVTELKPREISKMHESGMETVVTDITDIEQFTKFQKGHGNEVIFLK